VFVGILDHHDRTINHCADGDRNTAKRHDVRGEALPSHYQEREQNADRQRHDRYEGRTHVQQERNADQTDDDEFLDQLAIQVVNRAFDQRATVVHRHDLDTGREAMLE
jgi:hypothetical protein